MAIDPAKNPLESDSGEPLSTGTSVTFADRLRLLWADHRTAVIIVGVSIVAVIAALLLVGGNKEDDSAGTATPQEAPGNYSIVYKEQLIQDGRTVGCLIVQDANGVPLAMDCPVTN